MDVDGHYGPEICIFCGEDAPIRMSTRNKPFLRCTECHTTVWLNTRIALAAFVWARTNIYGIGVHNWQDQVRLGMRAKAESARAPQAVKVLEASPEVAA